MRWWRCWGRVEMVAVLKVLNEELEGLNAKALELEATIGENVNGIMEALLCMSGILRHWEM
jgi:hypothetical protein